MATRKINEDALIKQVFKKVNKDLGIAAKTPTTQMKSFNEKLKAIPTPFLYRIKDVWKAFTALMVGFFTIGFIIARFTISTEVVIQTASVSSDIYDFNAFDTNGDGKITLAEVESRKQAVATVRFVSPDQYEFKAFDNDGDGQLNLAEAQAAKEALAINQFEFSDKDLNGKLNYEESTQAVYSMTQNKFDELDTDEDRHLSFEEVDQDIAYLSDQQFNKLDRNEDGKLAYNEAQYLFVIIFIEG
jgi:Ca2+-binding EF-hand superfamily protein